MFSQTLMARHNLQTMLIDTPNHKKCTLQFWFKAGSALESNSDRGIAHFLEHMFFKGTKKLPGEKLTHLIEKVGGEINAFTSFAYTCYYINCPSLYIKDCLKLLVDMISNPVFENKGLISERDVVLEEYKRSFDSPQQFQFKELQKQAFSGKYAHPILGTPHTIKKFNRDQVFAFRNKYYTTANSLLIVAGALEGSEPALMKIINEHHVPEGKVNQFGPFTLNYQTPYQAQEKDIHHSALLLACMAENMASDLAAPELLALNCMAHGESSLLYKKLISQEAIVNNLSYSTLYFPNKGVHLLKFHMPISNYTQFEDTLQKELGRLAQKGFSTREVEKIKNQYLSLKIYNKESLESYAFALGHNHILNNDIHIEDKLIEKVKAVQVDDISEAFNRILKEKFVINHQVPQETSSKLKNHFKSFSKKLNLLAREPQVSSTPGRKRKSKVMSYSEAGPELIPLSKGVSLIYNYDDFAQTFCMQVLISGGLTEETLSNNGTYYLLSHLLTKEYQGISESKLKFDLENHCTSLASFAGKNAYGVTMHGLASHFQVMIHHALKSICHPKIGMRSLNLEKELTLRALANKKKSPVNILFKHFHELVFGNHSYALDILGHEESIKGLKLKDMLQLHEKNMQEKEIVFSFSGALKKQIVINELKSYVENLKKTSRQSFVPPSRSRLTHRPTKNFEFIPFEREQAHIMLGWQCAGLNTPEEKYIKVLTTFLSGQSSPLFVKIRDKLGLCYTVQAIHFNALEQGYWGIYIGTGNEKVTLAITKIKELLREFQVKGFKDAELENTKQMIKGQNQLALESNEDFASTYGLNHLFHLNLDYNSKMTEAIEKIKISEFNSFLKSFLGQEQILVLTSNDHEISQKIFPMNTQAKKTSATEKAHAHSNHRHSGRPSPKKRKEYRRELSSTT